MQELTTAPQPHLVVGHGATAYCYTCDQDILRPREDLRCPREVKAEYNREHRARAREMKQWATS